MFSSVFRGSQGAIAKTLTSRSSIYRPQIPSRTPSLNSSTAFQPLFRRAFSSTTPNASREQLSNKDAPEATKKAYEAHLLALKTERQPHRKDLGYTAAGRDTTADVLDFIRRKSLVAVNVRESAPTCREYVRKLERAAAWEKESRAQRWGRIRDVGLFVMVFLVLNNVMCSVLCSVLHSVLDYYGIRSVHSPSAKTSEADEKGEEKSVTEAEVATVTAKESAA